MNVAVAHGNYFQRGGGERVADAIAETFDAPLYYGFGNAEETPDDRIQRHKLFNPNPVSKHFVRNIHHWRDFLFMWNASHSPELFDYDVVIESGNEFGWYVPKQLDQTVIKYVHSPPRGPYDMHYKHGGSRLHRAYALVAKVTYDHTTSYVDRHLANSEVVAKRCRKAWGIDPDVVYPPVDVTSLGQSYAQVARPNTYLTFSRLYRNKRILEIIQAFNETDRQLIVGGDGPRREALEEIAGSNVEIRGYLDETEKRRLLAECRALVFNAENEDFGIVPVESFAAGTPVIGIADGFTKHQIRDGENGMLFEDGNPESIRTAVDRFERDGVSWDSHDLERFADQFSAERFKQQMHEQVHKAMKDSEITTDLHPERVMQ